MAKLYFRYGAMGSSKTANAIMVKYNYYERGKRALLIKPAVDVRDGKYTIQSRCGLKDECVLMDDLDVDAVKRHEYDCLIVDEAQFLTHAQVELLTEIVDDYDVPVICYGLRTDFRTRLFPGSRRLLELADSIEEVKTTCAFCNRKGIFNLRLRDGKPSLDGPVVELEGPAL